jgi:glutamate racemase
MSQPVRPLGVFDSGLGGLTVVRALLDLLPDEPLLYFGDTGRFPYGPKPAGEVRAHAIEITELLLRHDVQMVVVACNSASAVALDDLRDLAAEGGVPVVGVIEPGVRAALRATRTGHVGVIGTVGTIRSGAYQRVASALAGDDVELTCAACPGFVEFVEAGDVDSEQVHILAERLLAPVLAAKVDTLVLGCTHYPLLARTISDVMGPDVVLMSSADETAFEVRTTLGGHGRNAGRTDGSSGISAPARRFFTSGDVVTFRTLGARFLGPEVDAVEAWTW